MVLEVRSLRKAAVPSTLIENPSPGNLQSTRLALHVNEDGSSCLVYIASGCHVYKLLIPMDNSSVRKGKESLLIPVQTQVMDSSSLNRCPHQSEIQSIALSETESPGYLVLGSVDDYGHLIVSKLDTSGKDIDQLTYSVLPRDSGVGEGSWAGLCFSRSQWSMAAVARSFCKSIDVYDQDIHVRSLHTLWYPSSLNFLENSGHGSENSILAVAEGCQLTLWDLRMKISGSLGDIFYAVCSSSTGNVAVGGADRTVTIYDPRRLVVTIGLFGTMYGDRGFIYNSLGFSFLMREITGLVFSSLDPDYIYIQGVDYEVLCGQWKECKKVFSFRGDSNWLGFSKCCNRDVVGGWCDSGSIFMADVGVKESEINMVINP